MWLMVLFLGLSAVGQPLPTGAKDWYSLGLAQFSQRDFKAAKASFERAISLDNRFADAYKGRGLAQLELQDYDGAYHSWIEASELNPKDAKTKYYLGRVFYEADFPNEAAAWLRQCLELTPKDYAAMTYLGLSAEALSYDDVAEKLYENAIFESRAAHAPYSWAFLSLGKLLQKRGENDNALTILEQGEKECPEAHELAVLGHLLASRNQQTRAEQVLKRAVDMDPGLAEAHYRLALLFQTQGKKAEADREMSLFQKVKAEEKQTPKILALRK
jgi:tetratricopeptide (TPR) repeat protein